ncbi:hypothetical protein RLEG3_12325 [Rhizobium leguminosarum bv. trifolii WSM1689]|uniref:hypothetical protein n=1 Tax=Rhizobium leguminosarum TaxID=384 RepID=UPI0003E0A0C3|nr:hypothetical protein [Rhizobium leguminosarum]AHF86637.1 hypothetical protein RLEG3_12325 [Rhizobium leguminosarum bv. trifolii WSM1689]
MRLLLRLDMNSNPHSLEAELVGAQSVRVKVPALMATSSDALFENVWLVGEAAQDPPGGWQSRSGFMRPATLFERVGAEVDVDDARLAAGLVIEAANRLRGALAYANILDVVLYDAPSNGKPPAWLELVARRLGWRGWVGQSVVPGSNESSELGVKIVDRPCPIAIYSDRIDQSWHAIEAGVRLPVRTSRTGGTGDRQDLCISWTSPNDNVLSIKEDFVNAGGVGRHVIEAVALGMMNPIDGLSMTVEIDGFGRILLSYTDEFERPVPIKESGANDYLIKLYLDNALIPGLSWSYPAKLATIAYNGGAAELAKDAPLNFQHLVVSNESLMRPLINFQNNAEEWGHVFRNEPADMKPEAALKKLQSWLIERAPPDLLDLRSLLRRRVKFKPAERP